jgi:hypothetical protein
VFAGHNEHESSPGESLKLPGGHGVQDRDLGMISAFMGWLKSLQGGHRVQDRDLGMLDWTRVKRKAQHTNQNQTKFPCPRVQAGSMKLPPSMCRF